MDIPDLPVRLIVLAVALCLSGFFSGSETALFSFQPDELARMKGAKGADRAIASLRGRPKRLLITILFGNMLVNVVFFSVSYLLILELEPAVGRSGVLLLGVGSLLVVLIGGEVMPKNFAVTFYHPVGRAVAFPLLVIQKALLPVVIPLEKAADAIASLAGHGTPGVRADELRMLVSLGAREGVVDASAGEMLADVIGLSEVQLSELMVPRTAMVSFNLRDPARDLLPLFRREKLTAIPVYDGKMDEMLGVIHIKDLLLKPEDQSLESLVRPSPFLPETASVEEALLQCRRNHKKMAFVVDEHGSVAGLVTIEDLLEEIVGEIADEYDVEPGPDVEELAPGLFRVRGSLSLREWQEAFDIELPDVDVDTVGGLVMTLLDKVPEQGDVAGVHGVEFTVESVDGRRAATVLTKLPGYAKRGSRNE